MRRPRVPGNARDGSPCGKREGASATSARREARAGWGSPATRGVGNGRAALAEAESAGWGMGPDGGVVLRGIGEPWLADLITGSCCETGGSGHRPGGAGASWSMIGRRRLTTPLPKGVEAGLRRAAARRGAVHESGRGREPRRLVLGQWMEESRGRARGRAAACDGRGRSAVHQALGPRLASGSSGAFSGGTGRSAAGPGRARRADLRRGRRADEFELDSPAVLAESPAGLPMARVRGTPPLARARPRSRTYAALGSAILVRRRVGTGPSATAASQSVHSRRLPAASSR